MQRVECTRLELESTGSREHFPDIRRFKGGSQILDRREAALRCPRGSPDGKSMSMLREVVAHSDHAILLSVQVQKKWPASDRPLDLVALPGALKRSGISLTTA